MSTKRKAAAKLVQPVVKQSAKGPSRSRIDETKTSVSASAAKPAETAQTIEISSDSESVYDGAEDSMDEDDEEAQTTAQKPSAQSTSDADVEMNGSQSQKTQGQDDEDSDAEPTSPTFGDLLRNNEMVEVPSSLAAQRSAAAALTPSRTIAPPATSSLGTVLNQALRTDDTDLLESCLHTTDLTTVRNTIQRMDSSLAGTLLTKLAARMHRRPGRAHSLMSWVQWTLVAHGGALATQPDLVKRLGELNRVLEERARGLNSLLALKGKLDMLEAQMQLRRTRRTRGSAPKEEDSDEEDADEEGIIYVEGEEEDGAGLTNGLSRSGGAKDDEDEFPIANGVSDSEDDDLEDDDDDINMDEARSAAEESLDEDDVDHEDVEESADEEESDVETAPPPKVQKTSKGFSKRR